MLCIPATRRHFYSSRCKQHTWCSPHTLYSQQERFLFYFMGIYCLKYMFSTIGHLAEVHTGQCGASLVSWCPSVSWRDTNSSDFPKTPQTVPPNPPIWDTQLNGNKPKNMGFPPLCSLCRRVRYHVTVKRTRQLLDRGRGWEGQDYWFLLLKLMHYKLYKQYHIFILIVFGTREVNQGLVECLLLDSQQTIGSTQTDRGYC